MSVEEIAWIIQHAEAEHRHLHAVGAAYSFEDLWTARPAGVHVAHAGAADKIEDWIVDLSKLSEVHSTLISGHSRESALTPDWSRRQQFSDAPDKLVHVHAGKRLYDLNVALSEAHLALPTMGGAQGQRLAGVFSTSTHGSDWKLPPLCDLVQAIHLVTTGGHEMWIESKTNPLTNDDAKLRAAISAPSDLQVIRDDDLLHAVQVGLGRFGIIYSVVLKVTKAFRLAEFTQKLPWEKVKHALDAGVGRFDGTPFGSIDTLLHAPPTTLQIDGTTGYQYFDLVFNPRKHDNVWVRRRWRTDARDDLHVASSANFLCCTTSAHGLLIACGAALRAHSGAVAAIPIYGAVKAIEINGRAQELEIKSADPHLTGGEALSMALNAIWGSQIDKELGWLVDEMTDFAIGDQMKGSETEGRCGANWHICAGQQDPKTLGDCYRGNSIELIFGLGDHSYLRFIDRVLAEAGNQLHAGYMSVRFTAMSSALLSMHTRHQVNCSVEITSLRGVSGNSNWLRWCEDTAVEMGGRPHWGQQNTLDAKQVEHLYGHALATWRTQLQRVVGSSTTFSNRYTQARGLEPAK